MSTDSPDPEENALAPESSPPPPPVYGWNPEPPSRSGVRPAVIAAVVSVLVLGLVAGVAIAVANHNSAPGGAAVTHTPGSSQADSAAAATLYHTVLANVRASSGFHYVSTSGGAVTQTITGDAGRSDGRQVITLTSGYGPERFTLVLVGDTVYFQGNAAALQDQLGVPTSTAASLNGQWVSVAGGDGPYRQLAQGIVIADQVTEIALGPTGTISVKSHGVAATRITGTVPAMLGAPPGTGYLDVATKTKLPIDYSSTVSENGISLTDTVVFSAWGTAPAEAAPPASTAWSTLGASPPPGGYGSGGTGGSGATPIIE
jgi:hypothetical protein